MPPPPLPVSHNPPFAVRGALVLESDLTPGTLIVEGGRIRSVTLGAAAPADLPSTVYEAAVVSAGFIDLQLNGGFGVEVSDRPEDIRHLASRLPASGVTAFLPTLVSSAPGDYPRVARAFEASRHAAGAQPLGFHLEGPFLSLRQAGAHRVSAIEAAHPSAFDEFLDRDALRLVTLAPEVAGRAIIERLCARGVVVSLGHTDASYDELVEGIDAGATMVTHLYNAMSRFHHRAPGAVGAALDDARVTVGVIPDGVHSHPASLRLAVRAKGPAGIAVVTDAISGAGMAPGAFELDGRSIEVGAAARLADGTLAGSVLTMDQAVRNVVAWTGTGVANACRMASEVPARLLQLPTKGRLLPGADADLVLLDESLHVVATYGGGRCLFRREGASDARGGIPG